MLSVGSRADVRGLGMELEGMEEEENELEEGEACSDQDDGGAVDPDTAYSYIDEKIKNVLGHFQKEFEGPASVESLGATFGIYGSFLPVYPRSPMVASQHKSPQKPVNNFTRSQVCQNTSIPANSLASLKNNNGFTPQVVNAAKKDTNRNALDSSPGRNINDNDCRSLKVRIKVGSENSTVRSNADIYSGLGLEMSPSLSPEGSPNGGFSPEAWDYSYGSPLTVFQFYSCFNAPNIVSSLLSPMPESLSRMMEKKTAHLVDFSINGVNNIAKSSKDLSAKFRKHGEKTSQILEMKTSDDKYELQNATTIRKKEIFVESHGGKEPSSSAKNANLPKHASDNAEGLPASRSTKDVDICKGSGVIDENGEPLPESMKHEFPNAAANKIGRTDVLSKGKTNSIPSSVDKVTQHGKMDAYDNSSRDRKKVRKIHADKGSDSSLADFEGRPGLKNHLAASTESASSKSLHMATLPDAAVKTLDGREKSSGLKSKAPCDQIGEASNAEFLNEDPVFESRVPSKEKKKNPYPKADLSEGKMNTLKSTKEPNRSSNAECIISNTGPLASQQGEEKSDTPGNIHKRVFDDSKPNHKKHSFAEKAKDKNVNKIADVYSASEAYDKKSQDLSFINNCSASDMIPVPAAPVLINEDWVCCDKCHTWRLLPYHIKPEDLPKKWLCSMLTWLPGMNSCNFTEAETTAALNELYHLPPDSQPVASSVHHDVAAPGVKVVDPHHLHSTFDRTSSDSQGMARKKSSARNSLQDHRQLPLGRTISPSKGASFASTKSRSLNEVNGCPKESEVHVRAGSRSTSKSTDFNTEKLKHKRKEKQSSIDGYSGQGDFNGQKSKKSKAKHKREFIEDDPVSSKKIKSKDPHADHNWSNHELDQSGPPSKASDKYIQKDYASTKNLKLEPEEPQNRLKIPMDAVANGEIHDHCSSFNDGSSDNMKKRKIKEPQKNQTSYQNDFRPGIQEKATESLHRKEKKLKPSGPDGKETTVHKLENSVKRSSLVTRIPLSSSREHLLTVGDDHGDIGKAQLIQRNADRSDTLKRDFGYSLNANAATSSSSKISGSHKSKTDMERKGSPVDSVSSSPSRNSMATKLGAKLSKRRMSNGSNWTMETPERHFHGETDNVPERAAPRREEKTTIALQVAPTESNRLTEARDQVVVNLEGTEVHQFPESNAKDLLFADIFGNIDDEASPSPDGKEMKPEVDMSSEKASQCTGKRQGWDHGHHQETHLIDERSKNLQSSAMKSKEKQKIFKNDNHKSKSKTSSSFREQEGPCFTDNAVGTNFNGQPSSRDDIRNEYSHISKDQKQNVLNTEGTRPNEEKRSSHPSSRLQVNVDGGNQQDIKLKVLKTGGGHAVVSSAGGGSNREVLHNSMTMDNENSKQKLHSARDDKSEGKPGRSTTEMLPSLAGNKADAQTQICPTAPAPPFKGTKGDLVPAEAGNNDASKAMKEPRQPENQNGRYKNSLWHMTANGVDLPTTSKKGGGQVAGQVLKEATDLKHTANRLKNNEGSDYETTGLYFQAALKFLHGAFLLEHSTEGSRPGNTASSIQIYLETAKLFEFCARTYERQREMASAALAYKCTEVAYLKVVYSKHSGAHKDCQELRTSMPIGESPSSSASDVDNPNNQAKLNMTTMGKAGNSPQVGNQITPARNRSNFDQILLFAEHVTSAMDASRRSHIAYDSAKAGVVNGQSSEGIIAVRRVLDFSFHDVEGLLRLVRLSMEFITR